MFYKIFCKLYVFCNIYIVYYVVWNYSHLTLLSMILLIVSRDNRTKDEDIKMKSRWSINRVWKDGPDFDGYPRHFFVYEMALVPPPPFPLYHHPFSLPLPNPLLPIPFLFFSSSHGRQRVKMKINRGSGKSLPSLSMLPKKDCRPRGCVGGGDMVVMVVVVVVVCDVTLKGQRTRYLLVTIPEPPVIRITLSMASPHLAK